MVLNLAWNCFYLTSSGISHRSKISPHLVVFASLVPSHTCHIIQVLPPKNRQRLNLQRPLLRQNHPQVCIVIGWAALLVTWPIIGRFPCTSVDITMTTTCFPEPATSSGHLAPFHLGDESAIRTLTCVFYLTTVSVSLPHHQPVGLFWSFSSSQATLGAPLAPRVYFCV